MIVSDIASMVAQELSGFHIVVNNGRDRRPLCNYEFGVTHGILERDINVIAIRCETCKNVYFQLIDNDFTTMSAAELYVMMNTILRGLKI